MNVTRGAVMLAKKPRFQAFLAQETATAINNEHQAGIAIRTLCAVRSRAEFNTDPHAAERYRNLIRRFNQWMNQSSIWSTHGRT